MDIMGAFFKKDEEGFTTVGMAVALLLCVVLAFGALQARWSQAQAGQVQYVADAAALAADGAVAELAFYAQVIDAVVLSLGIVSLAAFAASAVAAFIPGGGGVAGEFADIGGKVLKTRMNFSKSAVKGLNAAQKLLPALCTARALQVMRANADASGVVYEGVAIPFPFQGKSLKSLDDSKLKDATDEIVDKEEKAQEEAQKQEEAQEKLDKAKKQAWLADCGDDTSMRERAEHLADLSGGDNPMYKSVESWNFSVGFVRAKRYYKKRLAQEKQEDLHSLSGQKAGESVARKAFYGYALQVLDGCSVDLDSQGNERPHMKALPHGKDEFKYTSLYKENVYPVSLGDDGKTLHAWSGCSACKGSAGTGSLKEVDEGSLHKCDSCKFSLTTLWKVSGLTQVVESGFEYHYQRFVDAATAYSNAAKKLDESTQELKETADSMESSWKDALKAMVGQRIHLEPTGHYGCVVIVVAAPAKTSMGGSFMQGGSTVGARVAVSGAALAVDESVDQEAALQQVGADLIPSESVSGGMVKMLFGAWGSALKAYSGGVDGIQQTISNTLGSIPLIGTDMSSWVGDKFQSALEDCGLEPAEVQAYKPVLVSTATILAADGGVVASALLKAQQGAKAFSQASAGELYEALGTLGIPDMDSYQSAEDGSVVLAMLSLTKTGLGVGEGKVSLPDSVESLQAYVEGLLAVKEAFK